MEDGRLEFADRIALTGVAVGLSGAVVGVAFPLAYPDLISIHTWRVVLWISIIILVLSIGRSYMT